MEISFKLQRHRIPLKLSHSHYRQMFGSVGDRKTLKRLLRQEWESSATLQGYKNVISGYTKIQNRLSRLKLLLSFENMISSSFTLIDKNTITTINVTSSKRSRRLLLYSCSYIGLLQSHWCKIPWLR